MEEQKQNLISKLPKVRGRLTSNALTSKFSWFQVGGPAEVLFKPIDTDDLIQFISELPENVPYTTIGVASNLLIRDGGIPGVTIRLGRAFNYVHKVEDNIIEAGASCLDVNIAQYALQQEIGGLEFFSGIPGTLGGAIRMNAGAYGTELKDVLISLKAINEKGELIEIQKEDIQFSYRHCNLPENWIFISARLKGYEEKAKDIDEKMREIQTSRENTQPIRQKTGGSTFQNPPHHKAWQLIDEVGGRGLVMGDAMVSEKHCNFLINKGDATAKDIENLGETLRKKVLDQKGVDLHWEIRRIGVKVNKEQYSV